ncbi:amidase family protein [Streptomyces sp. NPDC006925]|uniref:amidase family protein n=1 Tax=Streptomyces sp. NPDC006925 TaxID=3364768 RepID=UPI0036C8F462
MPPTAGARSASADRTAAELMAELDRVFAAVDLLATPTTPNPPHGHHGPGGEMSVALTWAFNITGHPAISLPAGRTGAGEPVGLQLVAAHGREADLLAAAAAAETVPQPH